MTLIHVRWWKRQFAKRRSTLSRRRRCNGLICRTGTLSRCLSENGLFAIACHCVKPDCSTGEGGTGKSILELTKNVAHVVGKDWLGSLPETGPAFYLGAEDDIDELHIRLAAIIAHYGTTFAELTDNGLHSSSAARQRCCAMRGIAQR